VEHRWQDDFLQGVRCGGALQHLERCGCWGGPKLLVRFDDPTRPSSRPEFATDGKRLYFSLGQRQSDVWTVELVAAR